ncbi:MAG: MoaD/ThiS family protein [Deltaproteobacteria bacterium]
MRIEVKLYASLGKYMPQITLENKQGYLEIGEGTTIKALLEDLKVPFEAVKLIFVNGINTKDDVMLKNGDRLGVLPPVAGG